MIQTINPYASSRTAEIMSRYRPIAPRPETLSPNSMPENDNPSGLPTGIQKSPYLRNVWAHLQARPTRTRKRGRTAAFAPPSTKRARPCLQGLIPAPAFNQATYSPARSLSMHGFAHAAANLVPINCCLDTAVTTLAESVALPLLCCDAADRGKEKGIDLNLAAAAVEEAVESPRVVISPRPVRPVGSTVLVEKISDDLRRKRMPVKGAEEVEEIVEAEKVPTIVSDSNNKVRMCNSAYRELIGQPECGWLDCAAGNQRRIGGEISLKFVHSKVQLSMHGFKCRVKIEWESKGIKKSVNAYCHGVKLACPAKDYQFLWRFYETDQGMIDTDK
ncbi:hypothetical protein PHJA_002906700 [Phtheirospermum japonicum]|uniref:DUF7950 domain-containing protein n=1 Tax=Phtheirospermum japonicum TaxID=374723 RepID=A0A830DLJ1_9LAMI|nr:hypothetical protein PHJA_002906700 [Phtheirospermum japonicum]